jgi:hypothetical protein
VTKELPTILFLLSHLPESEIKKILPFFGPLSVFHPWFMEPLSLKSINVDANWVHIKYPPPELKPAEDFKTLLAEYARWIEENQDKGYTEFLKASQKTGLSEHKIWEIRQMIRNDKRESSPALETMRWHLILHLAQDMENQRHEAERLLASLKEKDILFKGIIEESNNVQNPVEDLPSFESEPFMAEQHLGQIFEAWFALFGAYLGERELLLTFSRHVMDYINERWKEPGKENYVEVPSSIQFKFPDLSHLPSRDLIEIKRTHFSHDKIGELKALLLNLGENSIHTLSKLEALIGEFEELSPWELSKNTLKITIQYLPPFPGDGHPESGTSFKHLGNKTLVLVENEV